MLLMNLIQKILIVDDDDSNLIALGRVIRALGYAMFVAKNGEEALNIMHFVQIDLVITDVQMDNLDGVELARRIREGAESMRNIPIIFISGGLEPYTLADLQKFSMHYASKPVSIDQLTILIERARHELVEAMSSSSD